jgi:hypothetical protein
MIKLHYSLVDILDDCIQRLDYDDDINITTNKKKKRQRQVRPRTQIILPETKERVTIEITTSENFSIGPLTPSSTMNGNTFLDEDEFERNWILSNK